MGRSLAIRLGDLYRDDFRERIAPDRRGQAPDPRRPGRAADEIALDADEICRRVPRLRRAARSPTWPTRPPICSTPSRPASEILFEGAQGSLLDIDHGTFPFVTSSNSSGVGVSSGSGVPGRYIDQGDRHHQGVHDARRRRAVSRPSRTTRSASTSASAGNEYGTVTRRPRRCGWFDAVAARYTARLSGVDALAVMLLDVLSELPEMKICTAYEIDGQRITDFPSHVDDLRRVVPVYETLPGWQQDITDVRRMDDLPANARQYLDRLSRTGRPAGGRSSRSGPIGSRRFCA